MLTHVIRLIHYVTEQEYLHGNIKICVASLQKGPHVAIYQSRENRS